MRPKKSLGQHFLIDKNIAKKIVELARVGPEDTVVEIGPGKGILTRYLLEIARKVIAIEIDNALYEALKRKLGSYINLELVHQDALRFPYEEIREKFKVVANLPYYISMPILFRLLEAREKIEAMTLTLQKEVAARIIAPPGGKVYGVLSISLQYYTEPRILRYIPPTAFYPRPKVNSALVFLRICEEPRIKVLDERFFFKVVKASFAQRRKTLRNALKGAPFIAGDTVLDQALKMTGIDPRRRAETLGIGEFGALADFFYLNLKRVDDTIYI